MLFPAPGPTKMPSTLTTQSNIHVIQVQELSACIYLSVYHMDKSIIIPPQLPNRMWCPPTFLFKGRRKHFFQG